MNPQHAKGTRSLKERDVHKMPVYTHVAALGKATYARDEVKRCCSAVCSSTVATAVPFRKVIKTGQGASYAHPYLFQSWIWGLKRMGGVFDAALEVC